MFSDESALILHSNGDCFTYFAKNGAKTRQLVAFATNSAVKSSNIGLLDKLMLALEFFNTYADEPIFVRDEQLATSETFTKLHKFNQASWPGLDNYGEFMSQD